MTKNRRWLYVLLAGGLIAVGAGGGTFATFNAQVTNKTNAFSTGSLVLTDTGCKSTANSGNNNATCTAKLTINTSPFAAPGAAVFKVLKLKNPGTLDASLMSLMKGSACASTARTGATRGSLTLGDLCTSLVFFVEETAQTKSPEVTPAAAETYTYCWYGWKTTRTAHNCPVARLKTALTAGTSTSSIKVKTLHGTTIVATDLISVTSSTGGHSQTFKATGPAASTAIPVTAKVPNFSYTTTSFVVDLSALTSADSVKKFLTTTYTGSGTKVLHLTPLKKTTGTTIVVDSSKAHADLPSTDARTFLVGLYLATTAGNTAQSLTAKFGLTWRITQ